MSLYDLTSNISATINFVNNSVNNLSDLLKTTTQSLNISMLTINTTLSDNISLLSTNLDQLNTNLHNNVSAVNQTILQLNSTLLSNISAVNLSMLMKTSNLQSNISTVNTTLTNQINASNVKINQLVNTIIDLQKQIVDLSQTDPQMDFSDDFSNDLTCVQQLYINSFDIQVISNSVDAANFTGNFVFGDITVLNNAFIDVLDTSLSTSLFYLFKSQSYFYNIKIQVGTQTVGSGSIVSDQGIQLINKLSIISKVGSNIFIQPSNQLNILQRVSSGLNIRNLFINIQLSVRSVGTLDLVGTASGALNIRNYQILGTYYSTQSSSFVALNTNNSQIQLYSINFNPTVFTFGNMSSYFFCRLNFSSLLLQRIVLQIGVSDTDSNIITSISTTNSTDFAFGGIVNSVNYSQIDFKTSVFKIFASFNTQFINNSGQIFGLLNKSNTISVSQICYQDSSIFQTSSNVITVIGYVEGNLSFSRTTINFSISGDASFQSVGTIAFMTEMCIKAIMSDLNIQLKTSVKTTVQDEYNVSALVGRQNGLNWTVQNSIFNNVVLTRGMFMGIVAGICENSAGTIKNIQVTNSMLSSTDYSRSSSGGIAGCLSSSNIYIDSSNIINIISNSTANDFVELDTLSVIFTIVYHKFLSQQYILLIYWLRLIIQCLEQVFQLLHTKHKLVFYLQLLKTVIFMHRVYQHKHWVDLSLVNLIHLVQYNYKILFSKIQQRMLILFKILLQYHPVYASHKKVQILKLNKYKFQKYNQVCNHQMVVQLELPSSLLNLKVKYLQITYKLVLFL
ncbi:Hypothetical_protein [Hexamita inflata]|uniref:Hypothetical_protein n=1 Tax=Hexamita inflata TaxID=28002 RepID=A0AA86UX47_9EUKA|nr:Hypothetical protein HINF_LOCUS59129 [Hexamita inflata]